jgi:tannase
MRSSTLLSLTLLAVAAEVANGTTLTEICTVPNVQAALPANGTLLGIEPIPSTVTASPFYSVTAGNAQGSTTSGTYTCCNVTVAYSHTGKNDSILVKFAFPNPSTFKNRYYVAGGGGYALSSDAIGGLAYGASGAATSAGYDAFDYSYDEKALYGNGSVNWDAAVAFGYAAFGEMTVLAKPFTESFYGLSDAAKLYTYYEGCSNGGREGMSQVQRWGEEYDGVITGAPAFRCAHQQVNHVFPSLML